MSRLIAILMLAILLFPLAGVVYLIAFFMYAQSRQYGPRDEETGMVFAGLAAWIFLAFYWVALWKRSVKWTNRRITLTGFSFVGAAVVGGVLGGGVGTIQDEFGFLIGSIATPLIWQVATIFIWRENEAERAARLAAATGRGLVVCPTCAYNMSGLKATRCPECGSEYTLDALIAAQPALAQAEVER